MANHHKPIFRTKTLSYLSTIGFTLTVGFIICGFIGLFFTSALLAPAFFTVSAMAFTILVACLHDARYFSGVEREVLKEGSDVSILNKVTYLVMFAALLVSLYSTYVGLSLIINLSFLPIIPISVITLSIMAVSALVIFVFGLYRASFKKCNVVLRKNKQTWEIVAVMDIKTSQLKEINGLEKEGIDDTYPSLGGYFSKWIRENTVNETENYEVGSFTVEDRNVVDYIEIENEDFTFKNS